jgi:xanthine phosphoribosyltransferase
MNKIYYSYNEFQKDLKILIKKIDKPFDTIIPIARGGLTISHLLGEYYNIREVYAMNTIGYNDTYKLDSVEIFNIPDLKKSQIALIVDDIADSGETLKEVLKALKEKNPTCKFKTATLFYKKSSIVQPDYTLHEATQWIEFFWNK